MLGVKQQTAKKKRNLISNTKIATDMEKNQIDCVFFFTLFCGFRKSIVNFRFVSVYLLKKKEKEKNAHSHLQSIKTQRM